ncbi:DUF4397 domain-containing protein [Desertivirga xinjiangensis]|uniref:DUF4397 domain-containing protein n=1 Tax=Desertivirga xinjiangensis TaxID=539206 RepID=UPI002109E25C|nr:DUF4397 domain-containing protein [Pedobacter xinjiangensis]
MKTQTRLSKLMLAFAAFLTLSSVMILSSCSKDDDDDDMDGANIQVIHSAEGTGRVELYLDNQKVNNSAVAYAQSSGYLRTTTGAKTAEIKLEGSTQVVSSTNVNFESGKNYTIYVTNSGTAASTVTTSDNTTKPTAGNAKVRFVNLSALLSNATIMLDNSLSLSGNLAFGSTTDYSVVSAGEHNFKATAASNANISTNKTFSVQDGKVYTIYLMGTTDLGLNIVTHK